jgi:hypothetical protein
MPGFMVKVTRDIRLSGPPQRFVVVHYHIFKNAGSTVGSILEREFRQGFVTLHGPADSSTIDAATLKEFITNHPDISAISSHHLRYPKPVIPTGVIFDCCYIRHPLERLQSCYTYFKKINSSDPLSRLAQYHGPIAFLSKLLDDSPHLVSNVQVTFLANGGVFTRPADHADLERAAGIFREMALPGLVAKFDESLVAAEYFLKPAFPNLTLEYVPQNVSRPIGGPVEERQESLRNAWGADLYETLVRLNRMDLELFRFAEREIMRRFSLVPQAEEKLADFRSRCPYRTRQHVA